MLTNLLLALSLLLPAQQRAFTGQTYAVVVGISDYKALSYATGDLRFADRDARQFAAFLQSKSGGSVPASNIRLLTNRQATQAAIEQQLAVFQQATEADRIILYFSGHGMPDSFVPYDVEPGKPDGLLTYRDIKTAFYRSGAKTKLCIADACLSGGMTRKLTARREAQQLVTPSQTDRSNVAMLLASRSTQLAVEDSRLAGGAFTYFLLRGLSGKADLDGNGIVTIKELHQYVSPQLKKRTQGRQTPMFYGRFSDSLPLAYR
ncbi:caspase family protein [Spirosoma linguale]|uniref:Peptidase C14 caspase catalytic subunit p20 n=1 Tax=Spirosoma linguale (strain ATCC 33905 / DSM 74 / LMG 10896 / Claus 1) TaxID=504472 RepID=D2QKF5_SPILD|nr:peptidase C14 caspase catalytic subunit p20 [Spirosoma linguale DSM 74]